MNSNPEHLFVYGTLLLPQIMQAVSGQRHIACAAVLHDYARYALRGKPYPGIVPQPGASVAGLVYCRLRAAAWQRLDDYEDRFYRRRQVVVELDSGARVMAWTYVIAEQQRALLSTRDWSLAQFRQRYLQGYLPRLHARRH
ncbi:MAG: gamma-glutamylcyclotransferase family protein, partial [Gammaproteobacteria bacterium]